MADGRCYEFDDSVSHFEVQLRPDKYGVVSVREHYNSHVTSLSIDRASIPDFIVALMSAAGMPMSPHGLVALGLAAAHVVTKSGI